MIQEQKNKSRKKLYNLSVLKALKIVHFQFRMEQHKPRVQLHLRRAKPDLLSVVTSKCKAFVRAQIGWNGPPQPHLLPPPRALPVVQEPH